MEKEIGLIIWGTKGGRNNLFVSQHLQAKQDLIFHVTQDLRGLVDIFASNEEYYALTVAHQHKVFTKFKNIYDGTREGYIAVSMVIPAAYYMENTSTLLDKLLSKFTAKYVADNLMIKADEQDDWSLFSEIIKDASSLKKVPLGDTGFSMASNRDFAEQPYQPGVDLNKFFANPCLPGFAGYKGIFLFSADNPKLRTVGGIQKLTVEPQDIVRFISFSIVNENKISIGNPDVFRVNGGNCLDSMKYEISDSIKLLEIEIKKSGYRDYKASDFLSQMSNTNPFEITLEQKSSFVVTVVEEGTSQGIQGVDITFKRDHASPENTRTDQFGKATLSDYDPKRYSYTIQAKHNAYGDFDGPLSRSIELEKRPQSAAATQDQQIGATTGLGSTNLKNKYSLNVSLLPKGATRVDLRNQQSEYTINKGQSVKITTQPFNIDNIESNDTIFFNVQIKGFKGFTKQISFAEFEDTDQKNFKKLRLRIEAAGVKNILETLRGNIFLLLSVFAIVFVGAFIIRHFFYKPVDINTTSGGSTQILPLTEGQDNVGTSVPMDHIKVDSTPSATKPTEAGTAQKTEKGSVRSAEELMRLSKTICDKETTDVERYITECNNVQFASTAKKNQVISRFQDLKKMLSLDYKLRTLENNKNSPSEKKPLLTGLEELNSSSYLSADQKKLLKEMINDHRKIKDAQQ